MLAKRHSADDSPFFNPAHAKWVTGVLNMLVKVVGKDSLLGLLLCQTRSEIHSLLREQSRAASFPLSAQPLEN